MNAVRARTGEILIQAGLLDADQVRMCLDTQHQLRAAGLHVPPFGQIAANYRFASSAQIYEAIRSSSGVQFGGVLPWTVMRRYGCVIAGISDDVLRIGSVSPLTNRAMQSVLAAARHAGLAVTQIQRVPMDRMDILRTLRQGAHVDLSALKSMLTALAANLDEGALVQQIISGLYVYAMQIGASDIHLERNDGDSLGNWIAFRRDGELPRSIQVPARAMPPLVTRVKRDANLDYGARRPQDGRLSIDYMGRQIDIRVSTLPCGSGEGGDESVVLRIHDPERLQSLSTLFAHFPTVLARLEQIAGIQRKTPGLLLVTGATGCGKTTTLYALISLMSRHLLKVLTSEDPIEIRMPLVTQTQINETVGLTFATVLRAQVRQDPDAMVISEMRDGATVQIGMQAAESGHLVLATLHNDHALQAFSKLIGLLPPDYRHSGIHALASTLRGVINQRLVPALCDCAVPLRPGEADELLARTGALLGMTVTPDRVRRIVGCDRCKHTGYFGRVLSPEALFLPTDPGASATLGDMLLNASQATLTIETIQAIPGTVYFSRQDALAALLFAQAIDCETVLSTLDGLTYASAGGRS